MSTTYWIVFTFAIVCAAVAALIFGYKLGKADRELAALFAYERAERLRLRVAELEEQNGQLRANETRMLEDKWERS